MVYKIICLLCSVVINAREFDARTYAIVLSTRSSVQATSLPAAWGSPRPSFADVVKGKNQQHRDLAEPERQQEEDSELQEFRRIEQDVWEQEAGKVDVSGDEEYLTDDNSSQYEEPQDPMEHSDFDGPVYFISQTGQVYEIPPDLSIMMESGLDYIHMRMYELFMLKIKQYENRIQGSNDETRL